MIPGAILYDLANGGAKDWGLEPPYRALGMAAIEAAGADVPLGTVGAGAGAMAETAVAGAGASVGTAGGRTGAAPVSAGRDLPPLAFGLKSKGMTELNDAVARAAKDLSARPEKRRAIIILSDGMDTKSSATANGLMAPGPGRYRWCMFAMVECPLCGANAHGATRKGGSAARRNRRWGGREAQGRSGA